MEAQDEECRTDKAPFSHNPLSLTEWRTYLVMWNITNRSISLYDPSSDNVFIRYEDMKQPKEKVEGKPMTNSGIFNYYHMFIGSADMLIYRFHKFLIHCGQWLMFVNVPEGMCRSGKVFCCLLDYLLVLIHCGQWLMFVNVPEGMCRSGKVFCCLLDYLLACEKNRYGYGCNQICGSCSKYRMTSSPDTCNKLTGACTAGCTYDEYTLYIPPLYMYKPEPPKIDTVGNTTIQVNVPVEWKDEYKGLLEYAFIISSSTGTDFVLESEEHSLSIDWKLDPKQPFPCPATWYRIIVQVIGKRTPLLNTTVNHFPYKVSQKLPSYTSFTVTIVHEAKIIFSDDIRTLEEAPSIVLNARSLNAFDRNVTLVWKPPREPNGMIKKYEVTL
ncbi:hypothetical protein X777_01030, partial [Ooceraea biroi]